MANLSTTSASGSQTTTQDPQAAAPQTVGASNLSGSVQPGTASALLTNQGGLALHTASLTTVSLNTSTQNQAAVVPVKRHFHPALFGISILLCVIAIVLFRATSRSAKSTTKL